MNEIKSFRKTGTKRERTRTALVAAALEVIDQKGFVGASLDEIAAKAGMTKGAIYSNFGDKAELMLAVARARSVSFAPAYVPGAPLAVQLRIAGEALLASLPEFQKAARLQADFQIYLQREDELRIQVAAEITYGLRAMIAMVDAHYGAHLEMSAESLIMAVQSLSLGFIHQSMYTPDLITSETVLSAFDALARGAKMDN